jgi:hypothetical protein
MTLLETTYRQLQSAGLVHCAEAFSSNYLGKNHNWYAYQKHTGRDYSVSAAIQCLRSIRSQQRQTAITTAQAQALKNTEQQLLAYLHAQYCVADVC